MPTPLMKSLAKQAHKKSKTVEKLWKKAEKLVKSKYEIDEDSSRFYPLVVGVLKNFLGIEKDDEDLKEDGEGGEVVDTGEPGITTTSMGDYVYPTRIGAPVARLVNGAPLPVEIEIKKTKKRKIRTAKEYDKLIRRITTEINESDSELTLDDAISDMIKYYCSTDCEDAVDEAITAVSKYFGIAPSIFDDLK